MVKSSNYDFRKYRKETDYQAEINKALQEGDYYGAAVNEQFRNAKIELEGLGDKYKPTSKYLYCINPDGTKNEAEVAKFEAQQGKTDGTKVIDPVPNDYLGMYDSMTVTASDKYQGDKYNKPEYENYLTQSPSSNGGKTYDTEKTSYTANASASAQTSASTASSKTDTSYTLPTEAQAKSTTYWLNRSTDSYNFRDTHLMIPAIESFAKTLQKEYDARKYYSQNSVEYILNVRTDQIDTAVAMIDWYEEYIKSNFDDVNEVYGGEEIDAFFEDFSRLRKDLKDKKTTLLVDSTVRQLYSNEGEWLAFNNYGAAVELLNTGVVEMLSLMELLNDSKYTYAQKGISDEEDTIVRERESIEAQIKAWNERLKPLEKALIEVNTLNFKKDLQQQINTGLNYEMLEKQLENVVKLINSYQVAYNNTLGTNKERKAHFNHMVSVYTEQKKIIEAKMRTMKDLSYAQYRKASDWKSLSLPKIPQFQTAAQIKNFLKTNVNNPYYYINNVFGMRKYYKEQSRSGSDFNANGTAKNAHRYGGLMRTEKRPTGEFEMYDYMTKEEIKTYNYIYNKFGEGKANEYLKLLTNQMRYAISVEGNIIQAPDGLNYRWGVIDASDDNFLEKMGNSIGVGLKRFGINIAQLFSNDPIEVTKDEYRYEVTVGKSSEAGKILYGTLEKVSKELPSILVRKVAEVFNPIAAVAAESVLSVASSAGEAYREAQLAGYNEIQACNYATLIGASELCFGYIAEKTDVILSSKSSVEWEKIVRSAGEKISCLDEVLQTVSTELQTFMISGTEEAIKTLMKPIFEEWIFDESQSKADFTETVEAYLVTALTELQ